MSEIYTKASENQRLRGTGKVRVWDLPIRWFHWLLVLAVIGAWVTGTNEIMAVHPYIGTFVLGLILFRLIWGIVGSSTARFGYFLKGGRAVWQDFKSLPRRKVKDNVIGHSPLGGWASLGLIAILGFQALSGLCVSDDIIYDGPLVQFLPSWLAEWLTTAHNFVGEILPYIIGLHVGIILFYWLYKRDNIIRPMIKGDKITPYRVEDEFIPQKLWLALLIFIVCILASFSLHSL